MSHLAQMGEVFMHGWSQAGRCLLTDGSLWLKDTYVIQTASSVLSSKAVVISSSGCSFYWFYGQAVGRHLPSHHVSNNNKEIYMAWWFWKMRASCGSLAIQAQKCLLMGKSAVSKHCCSGDMALSFLWRRTWLWVACISFYCDRILQ